MKRLEPDQKNPMSIISYVPDSLKTKAQLDYIPRFRITSGITGGNILKIIKLGT